MSFYPETWGTTQDAASVYNHNKGLASRKKSAEFYEMISKHLNIMQVYIYDKIFLVQYTGTNAESLIKIITDAASAKQDMIVNERIGGRLEGQLKTALNFLDTPRDRQVVKGLLAHITSVKFATKLQDIKSRVGMANAKSILKPNLLHYQEIRKTSQTVK